MKNALLSVFLLSAAVQFTSVGAVHAEDRCDCSPQSLVGKCKAELKVEPTVVRIFSNVKQCSIISWKVDGTDRSTKVTDGQNFEPMITGGKTIVPTSCNVCADREAEYTQAPAAPTGAAQIQLPPQAVTTPAKDRTAPLDPKSLAEQLKQEAADKTRTATEKPDWETLIASAQMSKKEWDEQQRILALKREAELAEQRARAAEQAARDEDERRERQREYAERQRRDAEENREMALFALNAFANAVVTGTREAREFNENSQRMIDQGARDQRAYDEAKRAREEAERARQRAEQARADAERARAQNPQAAQGAVPPQQVASAGTPSAGATPRQTPPSNVPNQVASSKPADVPSAPRSGGTNVPSPPAGGGAPPSSASAPKAVKTMRMYGWCWAFVKGNEKVFWSSRIGKTDRYVGAGQSLPPAVTTDRPNVEWRDQITQAWRTQVPSNTAPTCYVNEDPRFEYVRSTIYFPGSKVTEVPWEPR